MRNMIIWNKFDCPCFNIYCWVLMARKQPLILSLVGKLSFTWTRWIIATRFILTKYWELRILRLIRMFRRCIQILLLSLTSCCISWIRNPGLRIEIIFPNVGFVIYLYFLLRFSSSIVAEFNSTFSRELRRDLHLNHLDGKCLNVCPQFCACIHLYITQL